MSQGRAWRARASGRLRPKLRGWYTTGTQTGTQRARAFGRTSARRANAAAAQHSKTDPTARIGVATCVPEAGWRSSQPETLPFVWEFDFQLMDGRWMLNFLELDRAICRVKLFYLIFSFHLPYLCSNVVKPPVVKNEIDIFGTKHITTGQYLVSRRKPVIGKAD